MKFNLLFIFTIIFSLDAIYAADDCAGIPNGDSYEDMCGTCDDDPSNDCVQDCAGDWGGDAWESDCGCVAADNSGDECDDCAGTPYGDAELDECGECNGYNAAMDCNGDCFGDAYIDDNGFCIGGNIYCPDVVYDCSYQCCINPDDICVIQQCGECSYDCCFSNEYQDWYYDNDGDGLGGELSDEEICTDIYAIEGSVTNSDDLDDACATNDRDECGICGGPGLSIFYLDANGDGIGECDVSIEACEPPGSSWLLNCEYEEECLSNEYQDWYYDNDGDLLGGELSNEDVCTDINAIEGSVTNNDDPDDDCATNDRDECGVCGGYNLDMDCNGDCFADAVVDNCGVCSGGSTGIEPGASCTASFSVGAIDLQDQTIEIHLEHAVPVSGFQFTISGADSVSYVAGYGGSADDNNFTVEVGSNNVVLGYSLILSEISPMSESLLTVIEYEGFSTNEICLSDGLIISGYEEAVFLEVVSYGDCMPLYLNGDINMDQSLNVLDVVMIVAIILEEIDPDEYEIWAADYSRDGEINVMDIVQMVYDIMSN